MYIVLNDTGLPVSDCMWPVVYYSQWWWLNVVHGGGGVWHCG